MLSTLSFAHLIGFSVAAPTIPTVTLNNGVELPMLSLGTCNTDGCEDRWGHPNQTEELVAIRSALKIGWTALDTAGSYSTEEAVGQALAEVKRSSVFVTTKIGGYEWTAPEKAYNFSMGEANENLERLNTDYVDLVILHEAVAALNPPWSHDTTCFYMQEQWRALEDFMRLGKARAIGVSNFCQSDLECILEKATVVPAVNELRFHVGMGPDPRGLVSYNYALDIKIMAYYALTPPDFYSGDESYPRDLSLIKGSFTNDIGRKYNKTGADVALRWLVQHGVSVVASAKSEKHQRSDLEAFTFTLDDADMQLLDAAPTPVGEPNGFFPGIPACGSYVFDTTVIA